MVERRTPERAVGVRNLPPPWCVLEEEIFLPESTGNTQEAANDMNENLLTGTLSLNINEQNKM